MSSPSGSTSGPPSDGPTIPNSPGAAIKGPVIHRQQSSGAIYSEVHLWAEAKLDVPIWSLSVSKSGILCGTDDGRVVLFDTNLMLCQTLHAHGSSSAVLTVQWSSDCLHFISVGTTDKSVKVWSVEHFQNAPRKEAICLFDLPQLTPVIAAAFHPLTFAESSSQKSATVYIITADRRIGVWTDGVVERYESLSSKDPPVCMAVSLSGIAATSSKRSISSTTSSSSAPCLIAVGTKTGELLLYRHAPQGSITFAASISCRNRRGKFSGGTPVAAVVWISDTELLVSSQDNRIRLVRIVNKQGIFKKSASQNSATLSNFSNIELSLIDKFRGHTSSNGEAPLGGFLLRPPFAAPIIQCGSECGRVFVWPFLAENKTKRPSLLQRLKHSRAIKSGEYWYAVMGHDKLTAAAPAPWNPEKGQIGGSCTVTTSLEGYVRLFFNRNKDMFGRRRNSSSASVPPPELVPQENESLVDRADSLI